MSYLHGLFEIIWTSNLLPMSVSYDGYSNLPPMSVSYDGYSNLLPMSVSDDGYSRGEPCVLYYILYTCVLLA